MFGAKGDGRSNDTAAFAALAAQVNAQGGGEIVLREVTYLVGRQRPRVGHPDFAFEPSPVLEISGCTRPLVIRGNGARLKCPSGLRFGTFEPRSGEPVRRALPNFRRGELATPYRWMVKISGCRAAIEISDLELDGSLDTLVVGGPWGDTGHQIPAYGLGLYDNSGGETLRNLHIHHHGLDGVVIDAVDSASAPWSLIDKVRCEYNGRQGCSIVGGRHYRFRDCRFAHTGRSRVASSPGAGVDIEAEGGKTVRSLAFERCTFTDNAGCGLVADSGDSADAIFTDCTFVGTTSWSVWPRKPGFRFERCTFVGALCSAYGDAAAPARAVQFVSCTFSDDPARSPTGKLYPGSNPSAAIADLSEARNIRFKSCQFVLSHGFTLPWSLGAIYEDCTMRQTSPKAAYPRGTYAGTNTIVGNVGIEGSRISGTLTVNGVRVPPNARG
jgi:hypothetical protein